MLKNSDRFKPYHYSGSQGYNGLSVDPTSSAEYTQRMYNVYMNNLYSNLEATFHYASLQKSLSDGTINKEQYDFLVETLDSRTRTEIPDENIIKDSQQTITDTYIPGTTGLDIINTLNPMTAIGTWMNNNKKWLIPVGIVVVLGQVAYITGAFKISPIKKVCTKVKKIIKGGK